MTTPDAARSPINVRASTAARLGRLEELLWEPPSVPGRGPKRSLSLEQIASVAVRLADAEGLGALSMQRVAAELDVTKMALYRYVRSKEELLALTVEYAVEEPPRLAGDASDWRGRLETWARLLRDVWQRHPWLPGATLGSRTMGPREVGWIESAVAALADTDLPYDVQLDAVLVLCGLVRTTATAGAVGTQPWTVSPDTGTSLQALLTRNAEHYPALLAALPHPGSVSAPGPAEAIEGSWETGLQLVLDGLQVAVGR